VDTNIHPFVSTGSPV